MYQYEPQFDANHAIDTSGRDYLYGNKWRDKTLLYNPVFLPRYAHLSRKVFLHYAGEHYNPHTISYLDEQLMRSHIRDFIAYRITHRTPGYDWNWLDHFFRKAVGDIYNLDLKPDLKRIRLGFVPPFKGKLHDPANMLHI